jgi:hypothetical protein
MSAREKEVEKDDNKTFYASLQVGKINFVNGLALATCDST